MRRVDAWFARGGAWPESQKLLAARGGACARGWRARNFWWRVGARAGPDPADFGLNGQIVMRSIQ